jgi:diacylglycerol kinase family enzyme
VTATLFVNPRAGTARPTAEELEAAARERGVEVHVLREGEDLLELARAAGAGALGAAGGDGTLAAVATVAIERGLPFVCVPFGTRNHFARDLGLDRDDPLAAVAAFEDGATEQRVDVGRVNGRLFLNNVSIGVYARLVHRRERHRRRSELFARARALGILVTHRHPLGLTVDGEPIAARIVLVANNAYSLDVMSVGERERLDEGLLHVYTAEGWLPGSWTEQSCERLTIGAASNRLRIAVDGEPLAMETPLELELEPKALRVRLPPGVEDEGDVREGELVAGR